MYFSAKKKIRGWKRLKRRIEWWKSNNIQLNMKYLRDQHRDYVKLWIPPFYGLQTMTPPLWYRRLLLKAIIDVYHEWHKQLKAENEDFYLKIWLYEPDFIRSQIVAAYKEAIDFYSDSFDKQEETEASPLKIYEPLEHELNAFVWEPHIHTEYYWLSDLEEDLELGLRSRGDVLRIKEISYSKDNDGKDEWYKVNAGTVWIGSLKEVPQK